MMLTLKRVNKAIAEKGWKCELFKDGDHFYVWGDSVQFAYSTVVGVYKLNHIDLCAWLERVGRMVEESDEHQNA
jgi:hypothetical protein